MSSYGFLNVPASITTSWFFSLGGKCDVCGFVKIYSFLTLADFIYNREFLKLASSGLLWQVLLMACVFSMKSITDKHAPARRVLCGFNVSEL